MKRIAIAILVVLATTPVVAQNEGRLQALLRKEGEELGKDCGSFSTAASCAYDLATEHPLHVAFGSIAPQNGTAFGGALVDHHAVTQSLIVNWSADAVGVPGRGAWRGGAYVNFVPTGGDSIGVSLGGQPKASSPSADTYPVYSLYAQTIALDKLLFFGLGPAPSEDNRSIWTMKQTIVGGSALVPLSVGRFGLALYGGIAGRSVRIGGRSEGGVPAINDRFSAATVPGLDDDRAFLQLTEGVRVVPAFGAHVHPLYRFTVDEFRGGDGESFNRWTVDLTHEFPFYRMSRPSARDGNTPNDCAASPTDANCPAPSRNRYGAVSIRLLTVGSQIVGGGRVPFYLQPTLGGSDINGEKLLTSFEDYWFRAPNVLAVQGTIEHSLVALKFSRAVTIPLGAFAMVEEGRAENQWSDLWGQLAHSYAAGLTIRAGGFPEVFLLFAWGHEGQHHFTGTINPALLGGASRPSLY